MNEYVLCSDCFRDVGLQLDASRIGVNDAVTCPNCKSSTGEKLSLEQAELLSYTFFVRGSYEFCDFGAAPVIQYNSSQKTCLEIIEPLLSDVKLLSDTLRVGFFYYGPNLWMLGEIQPLKDLQHRKRRKAIVDRIFKDYPSKVLHQDDLFFRLRINPARPSSALEYDAPPRNLSGKGRLDMRQNPVLYGSQDLKICIHECRVAARDKIYVATIAPSKNLKLLDITQIIEENVTPFDSLDLALHFLFLAKENSYEASRYIAMRARHANYDGIIYPSYFSLLRTGSNGFETIYGLPMRRLRQYRDYEQSKVVPNLALFGRPVANGSVHVKCINRMFIEKVEYDYHFGPAACQ